MQTAHQNHDAFLHWEGLQSPCKVIHLKHTAVLMSGNHSATLCRDDSSYRLRCDVDGISNDPFGPGAEFESEQTLPFELSGSANGLTVSVSKCYLQGFQSKLDSDSWLY